MPRSLIIDSPHIHPDSVATPVGSSSSVLDFFGHLFDTAGFPARWQCGQWPPQLGWLHIASDVAIFMAYAAIPASLMIFIIHRPEVPLRKIVWLFVAFILSCGLTHLADAAMFYYPAYRLLGLMKFLTAIISVATVFSLVRVMPQAMNLPRFVEAHRAVEAELTRRKDAEEKLMAVRLQLEERGSQLTVRDRRIKKALQAANVGTVCWRIDTGEIEWEHGVRQLFLGDSSGVVEARSWHEILTEENYTKLHAAAVAAEGPDQRMVFELNVEMTDGRTRMLRIRARADREAIGGPILMTGVIGVVLEAPATHP